MSAVSSVTYSNGTAASAAATTDRSNSMDKNAFLKLLITQLQYQDPLNPMDNTQFVAQMAQFTALEQMQNMNQTTSNSQAFSLVGKYILADVPDETTGALKTVGGRVDAVAMQNGSPYLVVNGAQVSPNYLTYVFDDALAAQLAGMGGSTPAADSTTDSSSGGSAAVSVDTTGTDPTI